MAETVAEKKVCTKCGADAREGTTFCYACGGRVAAEPEKEVNGSSNGMNANAQAALDDLAQRLSEDEKRQEPADKLAKAAEERKKARGVPRKQREFVWEPRGDMPIAFLIAAVVVVIVAALIILFTVVWK